MDATQACSPTDTLLNRRCALFTWLALALAIGMGLLAWGPRPIGAEAHLYADTRAIGHAAHGLNALASLPMLLVSLWGWRVIARSGWPAAMLLPWRLSCLCAGVAAVCATSYHAAPGDALYLAAHVSSAAAYVMLVMGFLAERVDARFGSPAACHAGLALVALAGVVASLGDTDIRPLLLLQLLPILLLPTGALKLRASHTRRRDWLLMLGLYTLARLLDAADEAVLRVSHQAISGHALMHLCLAGMAVCLVQRAARAGVGAGEEAPNGPAQASTSLSTSG